jgi:hypothetical protein
MFDGTVAASAGLNETQGFVFKKKKENKGWVMMLGSGGSNWCCRIE